MTTDPRTAIIPLAGKQSGGARGRQFEDFGGRGVVGTTRRLVAHGDGAGSNPAARRQFEEMT